MQFSDRFVHFSLQLLYSTLRYQNPWTLATFCIGTYTLYNLFTYWYSARFCQATRAAAHFSGEKEARERARPSLPLRIILNFCPLTGRSRHPPRRRRAKAARTRRGSAALAARSGRCRAWAHDLIELLARHAERGVAREAV